MQENLSLDRQDFELQPAFTRHGALRQGGAGVWSGAGGFIEDVNQQVAGATRQQGEAGFPEKAGRGRADLNGGTADGTGLPGGQI